MGVKRGQLYEKRKPHRLAAGRDEQAPGPAKSLTVAGAALEVQTAADGTGRKPPSTLVAAIPPCPPREPAEVREEWERLAAVMRPHQVVADKDYAVFERAVKQIVLVKKYEAALLKQKLPGFRDRREFRSDLRNLMDLLKQLGLTPATAANALAVREYNARDARARRESYGGHLDRRIKEPKPEAEEREASPEDPDAEFGE